MMKREQAYYEVFSYFLTQTLKDKKQIEKNLFLLQNLIASAEECLKNDVDVKNLKLQLAKKHPYDVTLKLRSSDRKRILKKGHVQVRRAEIVRSSQLCEQRHLETTPLEKNENLDQDKEVPPVENFQTEEIENKTSRHNPLRRQFATSCSPSTSSLDVATMNPTNSSQQRPDWLPIEAPIMTSYEERTLKTESKGIKKLFDGTEVEKKLQSSWKRRRYYQSHNCLLTSSNQTDSAYSSRDTLDHWDDATSDSLLDSPETPSIEYTPISYANVIVKRRKWILRRYESDIGGDYYFASTSSKPNAVKQLLKSLSKKCRQGFADHPGGGAKDKFSRHSSEERAENGTRSVGTIIRRLLSRLRHQDRSEEYKLCTRSWSTPTNLNVL